jgi:hypothetical protein
MQIKHDAMDRPRNDYWCDVKVCLKGEKTLFKLKRHREISIVYRQYVPVVVQNAM